MLAFLEDEDGAAIVEAAMLEDGAEVYAHAVNMMEVFYNYHRRGETEAQRALATLAAAGVQTVNDLSPELWQAAGRLKSQWVRVSVADCFGLALSQRMAGEFLTSDRHELEPIEASGSVNITFIR